MSVNQEARRHAFANLRDYVTKVAHHPKPENLHRVRTCARRVEAILAELVPELDRNQKKLLKMLAALRKKAGKVRDLDIHISALRNLKVSQDHAGKDQLLRKLTRERARREARLGKLLDKKTAEELRKRLKKADKETIIPETADPLAQALSIFSAASNHRGPLDAERLHHFRISGKRARYLAEIAEPSPEVDRVVTQLNRMQDVIGDWHDWLDLTQKAENLLGGVRQSALVAALSNITRAKFRQAVDALGEAQAALLPSGKRNSGAVRQSTSAPGENEQAVA